MIHAIVTWLQHFTADDYYHAAAFVLTGAGTQYTVQVIKKLKANKLGKNVLRGLNVGFNALYTAAAAIATGGIALGSDVKTVLALTTLSTAIYRIHNSFLYKTGESLINSSPAPAVEAVPVVETSQFAS